MRILDSARKHGFTDTEISHALKYPIAVHYFDGYQLIIGPTPNATLLEIAVNSQGTIFHAMKARTQFLRKK